MLSQMCANDSFEILNSYKLLKFWFIKVGQYDPTVPSPPHQKKNEKLWILHDAHGHDAL